MDLEQNLHLRQFFIDFDIGAIDKTGHSGLRNPGSCLIKNRTLDPVEEIAAVAKDVLHHATLVDLVFQVILPLFDFGESSELPLLSLLGFVNSKP